MIHGTRKTLKIESNDAMRHGRGPRNSHISKETFRVCRLSNVCTAHPRKLIHAISMLKYANGPYIAANCFAVHAMRFTGRVRAPLGLEAHNILHDRKTRL